MAITTYDSRTGTATVVSMFTDNEDGTITLRLHPKGPGVREVLLTEPTAHEYGDLRKKIRDADRIVQGKFPPPVAPTVIDPPEATPDDTPEVTAARLTAMAENLAVLNEYQEQLNTFMRDRTDFLRDPDEGPYAQVILEVVKILGGRDITLDDLPR